MATTTATKKGNTTATTATTATDIDTTTTATATGIDTITTATTAAGATEAVFEVGVERVDWTKLESALNKIGYKNVLQIIPEGSYGGTFFVIIYEVKTK